MPIHDPIPPRAEPAGEGDACAAPAAPAVPQPPSPARMTAARLREWVRAAQPGARTIYARGHCLDLHAEPGVAELARDLYDAGLLRLHLRRPERGAPIDYLAYRTARPLPRGLAL